MLHFVACVPDRVVCRNTSSAKHVIKKELNLQEQCSLHCFVSASRCPFVLGVTVFG